MFILLTFIDNFILDYPTAEEVAQLANQHKAKMLPGLPSQMMPKIMQAQQAMYQAHANREKQDRMERQGFKLKQTTEVKEKEKEKDGPDQLSALTSTGA